MRWRNVAGVLDLAEMPMHSAGAVNWLMLQSTELTSSDPQPKWWGFAQVEYQKDTSDSNAAGLYVPAKLLAPEFRTQSAFNVSRARFGVRGRVLENEAVNYFFLTKFGNNAMTWASG